MALNSKVGQLKKNNSYHWDQLWKLLTLLNTRQTFIQFGDNLRFLELSQSACIDLVELLLESLLLPNVSLEWIFNKYFYFIWWTFPQPLSQHVLALYSLATKYFFILLIVLLCLKGMLERDVCFVDIFLKVFVFNMQFEPAVFVHSQ